MSLSAEQVRADAALYATWRLAQRRTNWVRVLGGHNPHRPSYVDVYTPAGQYLGRIWSKDLEHMVADLSPFQREELQAATEAVRYRRVWRARGDLEVSPALRDVALLLGGLVREAKRELGEAEREVAAGS
ncbi:MAG: hypothetical protein SFU83_23510 [Meiothermus sp.]|nr:hypothetical protein [Meiothermus sp.]